MDTKIGIVSLPLEEVPLTDDYFGSIIPAYIPGITETTRKLILRRVTEKGIHLQDLGEMNVGDQYDLGFRFNRIQGMHWSQMGRIKMRDMKKIEEAREAILAESRKFDLVVVISPSHLGGIVLYEAGDSVARMDYHADFLNWDDKQICFSYASYMDWIKKNVPHADVTNYFVRWSENGAVFGREAGSVGDRSFRSANHFDIDVDCFDPQYRIQNVYEHVKGPSSVAPEAVLHMVREAKPRKLGIFEYRPEGDFHRLGLEFIANAIAAAAEE